MPVISVSSSTDGFEVAIEAVRLATKYMTPVMLLTDGYIANASEPWLIPDMSDYASFEVDFRTDPEGFQPFARDDTTLARPWVKPGTPQLAHRIGGIEKAENTGNVSYDPINHEHMVKVRAEKIARIADDLPPTKILGEDSGKVLVIVFPITALGRAISTRWSFDARSKSASIEMWMPGQITPPRYSPAFETQSKVVAVPKSTAIAGPPSM